MSPGLAVFPSGSRILCQICGLGSHAALDFYNRMNLALEGRLPTQHLSAMSASSSQQPGSSYWLMGTGANSHITPYVGALKNP